MKTLAALTLLVGMVGPFQSKGTGDCRTYADSAEVCLARADYRKAIQFADAAIAVDSGCAHAYLTRGVSRLYIEEYKGVIDDINKALSLDPYLELSARNAGIYYFRGKAKLELGESRAALEDFNILVELSPTWAEAYFPRGVCKMDIEDYQGALKDFDKALTLDSTNVGAYQYRGFAHFFLGDVVAGCEDLQRARKLGASGAGIDSAMANFCNRR
jgi:tetratricopeptide (TPR) repeat protein